MIYVKPDAVAAEKRPDGTRRRQGAFSWFNGAVTEASVPMFSPTREEVRRFLIDAWQKRRDNLPATPLETLAGDIIAAHPEYHALLTSGEQALDRDWLPEHGETNPFLHLSMHLSIREQVSIDQPAGVAAHHARLSRALGSALDAEHVMMDCLAEMIWQAQRHHTAPDPAIYLGCLAARQAD